MASNAPGACCVTGETLQGASRGSFDTINGTATYISRPSSTTDNNGKGLLFLTEANGIWIPNDQLLADSFAAAGYTVVMPDLFHHEPHGLNDRAEDFSQEDLDAWLQRHPVERVDPVVESTIRFMRHEMGIGKVAAVGYCFGAKYAVRWLRAKGGMVDAAFVAHPSFVDEEELAGIDGPLAIAAAESDYIFTVDVCRRSEEILNALHCPWTIALYSDVEHSFAVRGDPGKPRERWAKQEAFLLALRWFEEHL